MIKRLLASILPLFAYADFRHRKWAFQNNQVHPMDPEYLKMSHALYEHQRRGLR